MRGYEVLYGEGTGQQLVYLNTRQDYAAAAAATLFSPVWYVLPGRSRLAWNVRGDLALTVKIKVGTTAADIVTVHTVVGVADPDGGFVSAGEIIIAGMTVRLDVQNTGVALSNLVTFAGLFSV